MTNVKSVQIRDLRAGIGNPGLRVSLLGPMLVLADGAAVPLVSKRARALLAYLVRREGGEISRTTLAGLLWGERSEEQARASLRQALSELRAALASSGPAPITGGGDTLSLAPGAVWSDTAVVERAARSGDASDLAVAAELLRGEFLEGLALDEPGFEQWLAAERDHFRKLAAAILGRLMAEAEQAGSLLDAVSLGQRLLSVEPLQETVHRALMRLYAAQDRSDAALAQYERLKRELAGQLDTVPEPETDALARSIRAARRSGPPRPASAPPPPLPDKPSLAVLPFANLSGEPGHEFLADGMTDEIIAALSRIGDLFVISRTASATFKGRSVPVQEIARELGVRHVLEGSVRVAAGRMRVNAQLIDGQSGSNAWAERFEGPLADIFAVQDEITRAICVSLEIHLSRGGSARLLEGRAKTLEAWEKIVVARRVFERFTTADNAIALRLLEEALASDPQCTSAMALIGIGHYWDARYSITVDQKRALELAEEMAVRILAIDPSVAAAHVLMGGIALTRNAAEKAVTHALAAVELAPGNAWTLGWLGIFHIYVGNPAAAHQVVGKALRISPVRDAWLIYYLMLANLWLGDDAAVLAAARDYAALQPDEPYGLAYLAAHHGFQGRWNEAAAAIAHLREHRPDFGIANIRSSERYGDQALLDRLVGALTRAGLP